MKETKERTKIDNDRLKSTNTKNIKRIGIGLAILIGFSLMTIQTNAQPEYKQKIFVIGSDHAVWYKQYDGTSWGSWQSIGGYATSAPKGAVLGSNTYIFVRGGDNAEWYRFYDGNSWSGWHSLGGSVSSDPEVAILNSDLYLFVRGGDNAEWYNKYDGISWSGWHSLGGYISSPMGYAVSDASAIQWPANVNSLYLFARGGDSAEYYNKYDGTSWSGWHNLGGNITSNSGVTTLGGILYLFAKGGDNAEWYKTYDGTTWSGWLSLGGYITSDPDVPDCSDCGATNFKLFVRGGDNALWSKTYDETLCVGTCSWSSWQNLGGYATSNPASNPESSNTLTNRYVYIRGGDNAEWYNKFDGTSWSGWSSLGGSVISSIADLKARHVAIVPG